MANPKITSSNQRIQYDASASERIVAGGLGAALFLGGLGMIVQGVVGVAGGLVAKDGGLLAGGVFSSVIGGSSASMGCEAVDWAIDPYLDIEIIDVMKDGDE